MQAEMLDSTITNSLQLFADKGFKVRVIMRCAKPWFVAKDVATCIEHSDTSAMCKLCREKDVAIVNGKEYSADLAEYSKGFSDDSSENPKKGGNPNITVVSESGLYRILAKCNLPKCEPFESWVFDEVLPSIRKTGSYSVAQPTLAIPKTLPEALRAYADEVERREAAEKRAITAESERDEAIRTKAQIGSSREATAMNTASQKSKECKRLTAENEELKDAVGRGNNWRTVNMMTAEWIRDFGHAPVWQKLKEFSKDLPTEMKPIKDVEVKVVLSNGSEKVNLLTRYHREAWAKYREYEENLRVTGDETKNA